MEKVSHVTALFALAVHTSGPCLSFYEMWSVLVKPWADLLTPG